MDMDVILNIARSITPLAALAVAVYALGHNRHTSIVVMQANILKDLKQEFRKMTAARTSAAEFGLRKLEYGRPYPVDDVPAGLWQLMDFFDMVAMYLKRRSLDPEMVFISFYYWLHPYWTCFEDDVQRMKDASPLAMYDQIPVMVKRLIPVGVGLGARMDKLDASRAALRSFFRNEIKECGYSPTWVAIF
jgi:hypothetical protein